MGVATVIFSDHTEELSYTLISSSCKKRPVKVSRFFLGQLGWKLIFLGSNCWNLLGLFQEKAKMYDNVNFSDEVQTDSNLHQRSTKKCKFYLNLPWFLWSNFFYKSIKLTGNSSFNVHFMPLKSQESWVPKCLKWAFQTHKSFGVIVASIPILCSSSLHFQLF